MPRIAKADVNNALKLAAQTIVQAGGNDGRTSRAEMTAALKALPKPQKALADIFFKFIDNRDFKKGAQVTATDVSRAVEYAKTHMIAKYDLNNDGLSKDEIAKMSLTGKRAVELAKALKGVAVVDDTKLDTAVALGKAIAPFSKDAVYMSESDYSAEFVSANFSANKAITPDAVMTAFKGTLDKMYEGNDGTLVATVSTEAQARKDLKSLGEFAPSDEDYAKKSAQAFGEIGKLMLSNLTDVRSVRVGFESAPGSGKLGSDQGLYADFIIGRTKDGKLAGFVYGAVET